MSPHVTSSLSSTKQLMSILFTLLLLFFFCGGCDARAFLGSLLDPGNLMNSTSILEGLTVPPHQHSADGVPIIGSLLGIGSKIPEGLLV